MQAGGSSSQDASSLSLDDVPGILERASQAGASAAVASREASRSAQAVQKKREEQHQTASIRETLKWSEEFDQKWKDFQQKFDQLFELGAKRLGQSMANDTESLRPAELISAATAAQVLRRCSRLVVLTGAGISAESGIPTFRGADGFWTVGSENYRPQELATWQKFDEMPQELWRWYQYRWRICRKAACNAGHAALVDLEGFMENGFLLVTQNIDGLHKQAGSNPARLCEIHGRIDEMRCDEKIQGACLHGLDLDDPANLGLVQSSIRETPEPAEDEQLEQVPACPKCGVRQRPKILWFDECYNEAIYKSKTVMRAMDSCDVLLIVGTQLTTGLPHQMVLAARANGTTILRMDPLFDESESVGMLHVQAKSGEALPKVVAHLRKLRTEPDLAPLLEVAGAGPPSKAPVAARPARRSASRASQVVSTAAAKSTVRNTSPTHRAPVRPTSSGAGQRSTALSRPSLRTAGSMSLTCNIAHAAPAAASSSRRSSPGAAAGFFVYGTLRPDDNSGAAWTKQFCDGMTGEVAHLPGASLYKAGAYPALVLEQTLCSVRGVFLAPTRKESFSEVLDAKRLEADRIEGYPEFYDRAVVVVRSISGASKLAYVYHRTGRFARSVEDRIADGDWLSRRR